MSYILKVVRPSALQNWIKTNASGSLKTVPRDSWRAYLIANGGTGSTLADLERSFLSAQPGQTLHEKWANYLLGQSGNRTGEKARNLYK